MENNKARAIWNGIVDRNLLESVEKNSEFGLISKDKFRRIL